MDLYPDQLELMSATGAALREHRKVVVQAPTGSGKTVQIGAILDRFEAIGKRVLVLLPRRELAYQVVDTCARFGRQVGYIMAGEELVGGFNSYAATFDTLHARCVQRDRFPLPDVDVIIVDEVHLALAKTRKEIIEAYPEAVHIGYSATPARSDGKGLGRLYNHMVLGPSVRSLIDAGRLVEPRYFAGNRPDIQNVRVGRGDFIQGELAAAVDQPGLIGNIYDNWKRLASDRQTVIFCVDRKHSRHVRKRFEEMGVSVAHVDGQTPHAERAAIFEGLKDGTIQVLTNVYVATYGLDIPQLSCAILARPTKSIVMYFQTVGRVLRTWPGKNDALILDHAGVVAEHGFVDDPVPWSLHGNARNDRAAQQVENHEPMDIECPKCSNIFRATHICPACGHELAGGSEAVPYHEAELEEVREPRYTIDDKRRWLGMLQHHGRRKGFAGGWASHTYKEKFGVWPRVGEVDDVPPDLEVRNWITHRNIAYARRRVA